MSIKEGKSVTITLSNTSNGSFTKKGEIVITNFPKRKYNIVIKDSSDIDNVWDEDLGNSMQSTITLRPLSRWLIIRKLQIFYFRKINNV